MICVGSNNKMVFFDVKLMCLYRNEKAALVDDLWVLLISPKGSALLFICRLQSLFQLTNHFHNLNNYLSYTGV